MDLRGRPLVVLVGTRYPDLSIEEEVLSSIPAEVRTGASGSQEEILEALDGADVVIAGSRPRFTRELLERTSVRGIVRAGIGVDSVDLDAARERGIWVANVPHYGTEAVAFHTLSLIVAGLRRLVLADRRVREGDWGITGLDPLFLPASLTFGVVGFGRIGRRVAELVRGIGVGRVLAVDPVAEPGAEGVEAVDLPELLAWSDVVSLHAPGPADGRPLLSRPELRGMRPGALLVNTARGSLLDVPALVEALMAGRPGCAMLDVFPEEPPDVSVFAPVADRVVLTPHMAWYTEESQATLRRSSAEEAKRIIEGQAPRNAVVGPEPTETGGRT